VSQSEAALENELIEQLVALGFASVSIKDTQALEANLKIQLEKHNRTTFSDREFQRILNYLGAGNRFEKAKKLRDRYLLKRDDETESYIRFMDTLSWCKNEYQVTRQVSVKGRRKNRYDVTLLINGLPLVQIELKKRGVELKEAFNQINRYHRDSFGGTLYEYLQIFVISNGVNTKYFANNPNQSFEQTFYWSDEHNDKITRLESFTDVFLEKCHLSKMIAKYIVLAEARQIPMVLRPYQYYAVEKIVERVKESTKNGYIWHTTGSGKTLTSFKASQIITAIPEVKKVLFVVDRKDLDIQTTKEFNSFSAGSVDGTQNTKALVKQLNDPNTKLIVTTIQKLDIAISRDHYREVFEHLKEERVVLIFDECHRSQFGKTHANIRKFFGNAQLFGFTGTPIFEKNKIGNATTKDVFDECLHRYIITHAISDRNVLGFAVEYIGKYRRKGTAEAQSVREALPPKQGGYTLGQLTGAEVSGIDTAYGNDSAGEEIEADIDVDTAAKALLESDERIDKIVEYVLSIHKKKTKKVFNAIFAVSSTKVLRKYYEAFAAKEHDLTVATIFSFQANEEREDMLDVDVFNQEGTVDEDSRDALERYIADYNTRFGCNYSTENFYDYYKDVQKRVKQREIDILLVVNMFLTGFDAPMLNTLYVDKNLRYHGLIQAYSRTNRLLDANKPHGNIVCFRDLKKNTDEALELFGDEHAKEIVFKEPYEKIKVRFDTKVDELKAFTPTIDDVDRLRSEEEKKKFVTTFRELMRIKAELETYVEFEFAQVGIEEQEYFDYMSKYLDLYEKRKREESDDEELEGIDFSLELIRVDIINYDYIIQLLSSIKEAEGTLEHSIKKEDFLKKLDRDIQYRGKKKLIERFIEEHLPKVSDPDKVPEAFEIFWTQEKEQFIEQLASSENMDRTQLIELVQEYFYTGRMPHGDRIVKTLTEKPKLLERKKIIQRVKEKLQQFVEVFEEW